MRSTLTRSGVWFGVVGATAALVHTLVFAWLQHHIWPELANALGFGVAFGVSFGGHRHLSFADTSNGVVQSLLRFVPTALLGLITNEVCFMALTRGLDWPALISLWLAMGLAAIQTFVLSRYWAFTR
jgi:putative flippase GtrA